MHINQQTTITIDLFPEEYFFLRTDQPRYYPPPFIPKRHPTPATREASRFLVSGLAIRPDTLKVIAQPVIDGELTSTRVIRFDLPKNFSFYPESLTRPGNLDFSKIPIGATDIKPVPGVDRIPLGWLEKIAIAHLHVVKAKETLALTPLETHAENCTCGRPASHVTASIPLPPMTTTAPPIAPLR